MLYRHTPPHSYGQVKYAVDSTSPVNEAYLLEPSKPGGTCLLRKIADSWRRLTADGWPVDLALITNRLPDPADPLVSLRDARTSLLLPKAGIGGERSDAGRARARWAAAADLGEDEFNALLEVLRFELGRDPEELRELVTWQMLALGLRHDDRAVDDAVAWVARHVRAGYKRLDIEAIIKTVGELQLTADEPARAVLSIATLKPDPLASDADYALDWVDRFDGESEYSRRRPRPPATWAQLHLDIDAIPRRLPAGTTAVGLAGSFRQATAFTLGAALRQVTGIDDIAVRQKHQVWSSNALYGKPQQPSIDEHAIAQGDELAVAVAVALDPTEDVLEFVRARSLPVERLLALSPPTGLSKDIAIPDTAGAVALAVGIRDTVRRASRRHKRVHLFLAGPGGLAVILGHRSNQIKPTIVYEDVFGEHTYEPLSRSKRTTIFSPSVHPHPRDERRDHVRGRTVEVAPSPWSSRRVVHGSASPAAS